MLPALRYGLKRDQNALSCTCLLASCSARVTRAISLPVLVGDPHKRILQHICGCSKADHPEPARRKKGNLPVRMEAAG
jgi:hypothetical protein